MDLDALVPVLETARLRLRAYRLDDFEDLAAMWADPEVVRFISGTPSTREMSWARLLRYAGHWLHLGFGGWAVEAKADGRFLGEVGLAHYQRGLGDDFDRFPEAGWVFCACEHGQGYGVEAVRRMLIWADEFLPGETVCLFDPRHAASLRLAAKVGYGHAVETVYQDAPAVILRRHSSTTD